MKVLSLIDWPTRRAAELIALNCAKGVSPLLEK